MRKLNQGEEWRGKVTYEDVEVELSYPSEVEEAIIKGQYPVSPLSSDCLSTLCLESTEKCRVSLSGPWSLQSCCHPGPLHRRGFEFLLCGCGTVPHRRPYILSWIQRGLSMITFSYDPGRNIIVTRTSRADTGGARNKTYGPAPNNLLALV